MPAEATSPEQTSFSWKSASGHFAAEGIPIIPVDDAGRVNRYPLMRVTATDRASGQALATLDVVLPVSEETTCSECHGAGILSLGLNGPHGMHVVADSRWRGAHGKAAKSDRAACAACHGANFRGTALSRTAAARNWGSRTVSKGTAVGCYDCHNGPGGGD